MLEQKQMVKDYWEHRSSTFDDSPGHVLSSKREERAWKNLLEKKLGNVNRVLDVGAGTGFLSLILAEMGHEVVGVDVSKNMIDRAKDKAKNKGLKIDFRIDDAENLSFEDNSFDAVVNRAVLWTLPDPEKAVREWKRVLKPDGKLCFFVHEPLTGVVNKARKQLSKFLVLSLERRNPWNSLHNGSKGKLPFNGGVEPTKVVNLLEKVGFEQISAESTDEIRELKRKNMSFPYKIAQNHSQYCYSALKPNR